jgi:hypothetical protein
LKTVPIIKKLGICFLFALLEELPVSVVGCVAGGGGGGGAGSWVVAIPGKYSSAASSMEVSIVIPRC